MKSIVHIQSNDLMVSVRDMSDFSGNDYESVRRLIKENKTHFESLGVIFEKDNRNRVDYKSTQLNEPQATFLLSLMKFTKTKTFKDLFDYIHGDSTKRVIKKMRSIYIVNIGKWYKIGIATNFTIRLAGLQNGSPYRIDVIHTQKVRNADIVEKKLHALFEEKRGLGEWFKLSNNDLKQIIEYIKDTP